MIENLKCRILVVGDEPPPHHGSNVMCSNFLKALIAQGFEATLISKKFSSNQAEVERFKLVKILRAINFYFRLISCLMARNKHSILVHFISVNKIALLIDVITLCLAQLFSVPYILYFHGKGYTHYENNPVLSFIIKRTFSKALGGIVLGERLKADVLPFMSSRSLFVVPNMMHWIEPSEKNYEKQQIQVLFLSNLIPSKGPFDFVQAAKEVVKTHKNVRFVLAGPVRNESYFKKIKSFVEEFELLDCISIPGGVYGEDKTKLFDNSDIFVFPTKHETFGLVLLEAMAAKLPVITSFEGGIPEVVQDKVTGFLVDPNDHKKIARCIIDLIDDRALRDMMGTAGRERYEKNYVPKVYGENVKNAILFFLKQI